MPLCCCLPLILLIRASATIDTMLIAAMPFFFATLIFRYAILILLPMLSLLSPYAIRFHAAFRFSADAAMMLLLRYAAPYASGFLRAMPLISRRVFTLCCYFDATIAAARSATCHAARHDTLMTRFAKRFSPCYATPPPCCRLMTLHAMLPPLRLRRCRH